MIPPPTAKRMEGTGKVTITVGDPWNGANNVVYDIKPGQTSLEFLMFDDVEWSGATSQIDATVFDVIIEYQNSTGSRKQTIRPVPERIE